MVIKAEKDLKENWRYQYDILVLPKLDEKIRGLENGWVAPQSSIASYGGISLEDVKKIRQIPGVEIAAPLSIIGYFEYDGFDLRYKEAAPGKFYEVHNQTVFF